MTIDPALNVSCPTCRAGAGQPCRSRRAISLHHARRQALADLGVQADGLLAASREPESRKPGPGKTEAPPGRSRPGRQDWDRERDPAGRRLATMGSGPDVRWSGRLTE